MSTHRYSAKYKCSNDCRESGCPGHTLTLIDYSTSNTYGVQMDGGSPRCYFDPNELETLIMLYRAYCSADRP